MYGVEYGVCGLEESGDFDNDGLLGILFLCMHSILSEFVCEDLVGFGQERISYSVFNRN